MKSKTQRVLNQLRDFESPNVTFIDPEGGWPIVWERASGMHVWDVEGKRYLDLTAAFGVAAAGHANQRVVAAGQKQMAKLLHAMGDVHPHALKAQLARELSRITFERWGSITAKTIFTNSGFEAVEAALKTAMLATGKPGVIAFESGYHGLGYGALSATHRAHFRSPFKSQLKNFGHFSPFPKTKTDLAEVELQLRKLFRSKRIGAVLVEPIQVRGGVNIPPAGFLKLLRKLCTRFGALLVFDEIYTGFGRTGKWFACEHDKVVPDLICLGKALTGGFPLSACVGRADVMDYAWPISSGEAIHTSTFLGHPVGCAMALAQIQEIQKRKLVDASATSGGIAVNLLRALAKSKTLNVDVRGRGLLIGVELNRGDGVPATNESLLIIKRILARGFVLLPEGEPANVISLTPPLIINPTQLRATVQALAEEMEDF
ncbi:MAG: Aminotransferase class-III [Verrucomicrobiales bacterium]|nr:Aminotransferase class-III [Verrucomicrobiales bacterium]